MAPANRDRWDNLRAISIRCVKTQPREFCQWHSHPFDELSLCTDDRTLTGKSGALAPSPANTLSHCAPGEQHGFWNDERQRPCFWVLHFVANNEFTPALAALRDPIPQKRVWKLTAAQVETFKWLFMRLTAEHSNRSPDSAVAESGWLRLLLVTVQRWARNSFAPSAAPTAVHPDLLKLWQAIHDCGGRPADFTAVLRSFPNYNSLRHEFAKAFGCTPRQMAVNTRIEIAKHLLLESPLSIKQIAPELGYARQHEFARAFHRVTGRSPSAWRANPT